MVCSYWRGLLGVDLHGLVVLVASFIISGNSRTSRKTGLEDEETGKEV